MTYSESAAGQYITRKRAMHELDQHGALNDENITDFDNTVAPHANGFYDAREVLQFLGY